MPTAPHGEPAASDMLRQYIRRDIATEVLVPEQGETIDDEARADA